MQLRQPNRRKERKLRELQAAYSACAQFHLDGCQRLGTTSATKLHRELYGEAKTRFALPVVLIQRARDKAIEAQRSYLARKAKGRKTNPPRFNGKTPLGIGQRSLAVVMRNGRFFLRLSTAERRAYLWLPLVPDKHAQPLLSGVASGSVKHGASELMERDGTWYLYLTIYELDVPQREGEVVFGLDLGLVNHAVLSGPGCVRFWNGRPARRKREYFTERRRELGQAKLLQEIKHSKGKESRWMRDVNHKLSREIVDTVAKHGGAEIHVERLLGIRERTKCTRKVNRMISSWTFRELIEMIRYKAAALGIRVVEVDPRRTSRTCPRCGHASAANRRAQATFACTKCGFTANADYVAARNIAAKQPMAAG